MTKEERGEFKNEIVSEIDKRMDIRFIENNAVLLEAVSNMMDKKIQELGVRQDAFEDKIVGLIQGLNSSHSQFESLRGQVDVHETVIKTNILPRLDLLEKAS